MINHTKTHTKTHTKSVILLSGGLDSLTCLAIAHSNNEDCYAISFDYGQRHTCELEAAKNITKKYNIPHKVINLHSLGELGGSALTDSSTKVPSYQENLKNPNKDNIPNTYVPCRNIIFLSFACAYAEVIQAQKLYIGVNAIDYSGYPDCREEFINAMQNVINTGTKMGDQDNSVQLTTPLINLTKSEIIKLGTKLNTDYSLSVSCYNADEKLQACGQCDSCEFRKQGFIDANVIDPTNYTKI